MTIKIIGLIIGILVLAAGPFPGRGAFSVSVPPCAPAA